MGVVKVAQIRHHSCLLATSLLPVFRLYLLLELASSSSYSSSGVVAYGFRLSLIPLI